MIGPSCTRLALVVLHSSVSTFRHPEVLHSCVQLVSSPVAPSFFRSTQVHPPLALGRSIRASSPSIQTPRPGTVEIIKRRPLFGATSGIRVGALYSRYYRSRELGRDDTAFLPLFFYLFRSTISSCPPSFVCSPYRNFHLVFPLPLSRDFSSFFFSPRRFFDFSFR